MAGPLDALMMPMGDEEKMRALAQSLRGRHNAADFFSASTIPAIQQMAQSEQKYIQGAAEQQGRLTEALERRRQDQSQHKEYMDYRRVEGEEDRELRREEGRENRALRETLQAMKGTGGFSATPRSFKLPNGDKVTVLTDKEGNAIELGTRLPVDLTGATPFKEMGEATRANQLVKLGTRTQGLNSLVTAVDELDNVLAPYADAGEDVEDVPGMGVLEKAPIGIGAVTRFIEDSATRLAGGEPEAGANFAAIENVMSTIIRNQAGLSQTKAEIDRVLKTSGKDVFSDPTVFMEFYPRLKVTIAEDLANIRNTTPSEILDEYRGNLPAGDRDVTAWKFRDVTFDGKKKEAAAPKSYEDMTEEELDAELAKGSP